MATELHFKGIQIKSEEIFHRFSKAVGEIEELCGVHEVEIMIEDIFFCPWIDVKNCHKTPMEDLLIKMIEEIGGENEDV